MTSSKMSSAPWRVAVSRRNWRNPSSAGMQPLFASIGSQMIAEISEPCSANARSTSSRLFHAAMIT